MTRRERLAELMEARRLDLRLTWREVADIAGVTTETLRQIRFGAAQIQKLKQRGVEEALGWEAGGIARFLDSGEPPMPIAEPPNALDRECLRVHGMTAVQLYKAVLANKALALADRAAFVRAVTTTVDDELPPDPASEWRAGDPVI